jgi:hypothetical protein
MTTPVADIKQHREPADLLAMVADIDRRLRIQETARRLGNASIDGGRLTLRNGDLVVVDDNDNVTLLISHGATPAITMIPSTVEGGYAATQFAWESDANGASYEVHIEDGSSNQDGGKLLLNRDAAYLSRQPSSGPEAFLKVGNIGGYIEHIQFKGRWVINDGFGSDDAVIFGYSDIVAGFGAVSFNFPFAFDKAPIVVFSMLNAGTAVAADLSALSTTGFTVAWATGTSAKTIGWVAYRR